MTSSPRSSRRILLGIALALVAITTWVAMAAVYFFAPCGPLHQIASMISGVGSLASILIGVALNPHAPRIARLGRFSGYLGAAAWLISISVVVDCFAR